MFYNWLNNFLWWVEGPVWTFVKKWWKIIAIAFLVLFLFRECSHSKSLKRDIDAVRKIAEFQKLSLDSTVKRWQDQYGNQHTTIEKMSTTITDKSEYIDSIAKLLKVKSKNVESVSVARIETSIKEPLKTDIAKEVVPCLGDSIEVVKSIGFVYGDTWTSISGTVYSDKRNNEDSIYYVSTDTLTTVDYWKRDRVLGLRIGKIRGYVDYTNKNEHNYITGAKKIDLHPPKTKWSIGPSVSIGYPFTFKNPVIIVGISIQRTVIRF